MNERIKQLAEQSYHRYSEHNIDLQKFAESIIQECIDIAEGTRYDGKVVANRIKFVFGLDNEDNETTA